MSKDVSYDTVIVGAGMAGLTAAAYLSRAGQRVLLCEKNLKVGGLVNSFTVDGFTFDGGIRAIENSGIVFPMLRDLGLEVEFVRSPVSLGIEDRFIKLKGPESLDDYSRLLKDLFPNNGDDIKKIIAEIRKVIGYMDVLYGIDNPLFRDLKNDRRYLFKTVLPWLLKYQYNIRKAMKMQTPVYEHLSRLTANRSLADMIAQHFFTETPAFFALSYFSLYLDYNYPIGGTGALVDTMARFIADHGGEIRLETEIEEVDLQQKLIRSVSGDRFQYGQLIWAADLKKLYSAIDTEQIDDPAVQKTVAGEKANINRGRGGDSIFSLYLTVDLPPDYFAATGGPHLFYTPSREGLHRLREESRPGENADGRPPASLWQDLRAWLERFFDLNTFEISCPAVRDGSLAPAGQSGLIVSTLFDYELVREIDAEGRYGEFKEFSEQYIARLLTEKLYPGLEEKVISRLSSTPLSIERINGSSGGAITGWSFTEQPLPVENRFARITKSVETAIPEVCKAGQWSFSPSGLPVAILTGKLAADRVLQQKQKAKNPRN